MKYKRERKRENIDPPLQMGKVGKTVASWNVSVTVSVFFP